MKDNIVFARTELGQTVYDIYFSSMSAAEVVRRHRGVKREFVLDQRRNHSLPATRYAKKRRKP